MNVLNDKEEPKSAKNETPDFLSLLLFSFFCAVGMGTVFLGPLPMILAHIRLPEPWSKICCVVGAVIALTIVKAPLLAVLIVFVFGILLSDSISKQIPLWKLLLVPIAAAVLVSLLTLWAMGNANGIGLVEYWQSLVSGGFDTLLQAQTEEIPKATQDQFQQLQTTLLYQGPFLLIAGLVFSFWLSVGMLAHMKWLVAPHYLCAARLRRIRISDWVGFFFIATFLVGKFAGKSPFVHVVSGLSQIAGAFIFIQGVAILSHVFARRAINQPIRTLVYCLSLTLGFYVVVGLGLLAPWYYRKFSVEPSPLLTRQDLGGKA